MTEKTQDLLAAVFPKVFRKETVAMTDSLKVAQYFGKRHDNLLQSIKNLGCSEEFNALNVNDLPKLNHKDPLKVIH
uniref:Rha family transcriptional regulator n=1 Tax=Rodentibacter caecimuris TaxID=1796644 RepID=UPI0025887E82